MKTYITKKKYQELLLKLEQMEKDYRHFAETELAAAVDLGDIRENAEFDSAVWRQNHMAALISELRFALHSQLVFIDDLRIDPSHVSIGTKVTLSVPGTNQVEKYTILGPHESDFDQGIISYLSPLAKAMIRKRAGDRVSLDRRIVYEIVAIELATIKKE